MHGQRGEDEKPGIEYTAGKPVTSYAVTMEELVSQSSGTKRSPPMPANPTPAKKTKVEGLHLDSGNSENCCGDNFQETASLTYCTVRCKITKSLLRQLKRDQQKSCKTKGRWEGPWLSTRMKGYN